MTEAIKASWLTGRSDLWRQHTHKCLSPSVDVFRNKGEEKQLVTEEIKRAVNNACLFLVLMPVGGCGVSQSGGGVTERNVCFVFLFSKADFKPALVLCCFRNACLHLTTLLRFYY